MYYEETIRRVWEDEAIDREEEQVQEQTFKAEGLRPRPPLVDESAGCEFL